MKCLVCRDLMHYFFTKKFNDFGLGDVDYWQCGNCGFVSAKTLLDLSEKDWKDLNEKFHTNYHFTDKCYFDANWTKRLEAQAKTTRGLKDAGALTQKKPWLDYGCGDAKLSVFFSKEGISVLNYDQYAGKHVAKIIKKDDLKDGGFDMVISTSVFEHVRTLDSLDRMEKLVSENGCFAIHTLVREKIPNDPNWFYLLPVHCSLFTNKSMQILFDRWRYNFSIYNVPARLWFWYKRKPDEIENVLENVNEQYGEREFFVKDGFMDYWKE